MRERTQKLRQVFSCLGRQHDPEYPICPNCDLDRLCHAIRLAAAQQLDRQAQAAYTLTKFEGRG